MTDPVAPVEVALTIAARPETIFRYFTDPGRFAHWMGEASALDPEPGGRLRVGYPTGQVAAGQVVAVEPGRRIVFTWGYEGDGEPVPAGSSTVEITLEPVADGTGGRRSRATASSARAASEARPVERLDPKYPPDPDPAECDESPHSRLDFAHSHGTRQSLRTP
jgi:uncharacterized protein YndB with AHSA1/START domain